MFRRLRNKKSMIKRIFRSATVYLTIMLFLGLTISHSSINSAIALNSENSMTTTIDKTLQTFSQINDSFLDRPILDLAKDVNNTEINPDIEEWIFVNITIKNIGNQTAYNLTTVDPSFSDWAISSLNLTTQKYVIVEPNATIYYYYYFKPLSEGNFTLEPTTIEYYGIDETKYNAQSQRFIILSVKPQNIVVLDKEIWLNILYYSLAIVFGIGALVLIDYFVLKRPREVKKRKEKQKGKKEIAPQKSKKQIKRKTKKRR
jgi:uncharacterized membrane protein SpoIIM required for sporulation